MIWKKQGMVGMEATRVSLLLLHVRMHSTVRSSDEQDITKSKSLSPTSIYWFPMLSTRLVLLVLAAAGYAQAFTQSQRAFQRKSHILNSEQASSTTLTKNPSVQPSDNWELDCYSRPVMVNGKKLWEVLLTDSTGSFRLCETIPSNKWVLL